jgi:hypothetical protein
MEMGGGYVARQACGPIVCAILLLRAGGYIAETSADRNHCAYGVTRSDMQAKRSWGMVAAGILGVWLAWGAVAPRALRAQPSLVVLVRHGEKAAVGGSDPSLSEAGRARAQALADAVAMTTPNAIIVTSLKRTAETAAVVAAQTGVAPTVVAIDGGGAAHVAAHPSWAQQEIDAGHADAGEAEWERRRTGLDVGEGGGCGAVFGYGHVEG